MRRILTSLAVLSICGVVALAQEDEPLHRRGAATPAEGTVTCAFSNPGYSGWCRVTEPLGAGKRARGVCAQVLTCLNDVRCTRTYCEATTIRGGWKLEKVEPAKKD